MERTAACHPADIHARLTERHAAFHTARSLKLLLLHGKMLVKFIKILDSFFWIGCFGGDPLIFHKSCRFSHNYLTIRPDKITKVSFSRLAAPFVPDLFRLYIGIKCFDLRLLRAQPFFLHLYDSL